MQSFILPANGKATPKSIERKRKMAEAMMAQGIDTSPIASPWQGAARMAQALVGGLGSRKADKQEAEGTQSFRDSMAKALAGNDKAAYAEAGSNPFADSNSLSLMNSEWSRMHPDPTAEMRNYEYGLENPGFAQQAGNDTEYGLQPIVTQDKDGKYHLFQASKSGGPPKEMPLPYGWTPKMQFLNQETQFAPVATQGVLQPGQGPAPIPINNAQSAADTKAGAAIGDARADFASMSSKMPGLENVVQQLDGLSEKATYTLAGQAANAVRTQVGMDPSEGQVARTQYQSIVANQILPLLRDTFGAQFTAREGDTLMATLGNPDKTPQEKQAVLKSFIEQKRRDIEAKATQAGISQAPAQAASGAVPDVSTMSDQDLEAIINGP